jgi:Flp pilus assembly protein CpaB
VSRRARAAAFAILAIVCATASAAIASGYRDSVDEQLGALRAVVVVTEPLAAGTVIDRRRSQRSLGLRDVPVRFLPPDTLDDPSQAVGRKPVAPVPAGSYLLVSQLRDPASAPDPSAPRLGEDLQPVEITVTAAGALASLGTAGPTRVDVVVAGEPVTGGRARVRIAAEGVRLLSIVQASPEDTPVEGTDGWTATLALTRHQALDLIEAENFAREIRLIPAG